MRLRQERWAFITTEVPLDVWKQLMTAVTMTMEPRAMVNHGKFLKINYGHSGDGIVWLSIGATKAVVCIVLERLESVEDSCQISNFKAECRRIFKAASMVSDDDQWVI